MGKRMSLEEAAKVALKVLLDAEQRRLEAAKVEAEPYLEQQRKDDRAARVLYSFLHNNHGIVYNVLPTTECTIEFTDEVVDALNWAIGRLRGEL